MKQKMARIGLLICLVLTIASPRGVAAEQMTGSLTKQTYSIADTDKLYLTIVGPKEDARYQELVSTFSSKPEFAEIKDSTHFHALSTDSTMFKSRYVSDYKALPCVRVQSLDGEVVKEWSGAGIPANDQLLAEMQCLPHWRERHNPKPAPTPKPAPSPTPGPAPAPQSDYLPFWFGCAALVCGVVFAFIQEAKKN